MGVWEDLKRYTSTLRYRVAAASFCHLRLVSRVMQSTVDDLLYRDLLSDSSGLGFMQTGRFALVMGRGLVFDELPAVWDVLAVDTVMQQLYTSLAT